MLDEQLNELLNEMLDEQLEQLVSLSILKMSFVVIVLDKSDDDR